MKDKISSLYTYRNISYIYVYIYIYEGVCGIMVIVVENEHGDPSWLVG